jgi:hypothetical protein
VTQVPSAVTEEEQEAALWLLTLGIEERLCLAVLVVASDWEKQGSIIWMKHWLIWGKAKQSRKLQLFSRLGKNRARLVLAGCFGREKKE